VGAHVGATKASGITKLIISESRNFPEVTAFYQREVIQPGQSLIRRILKRGVDRGEFSVRDMDHAVYSVIAPMVFCDDGQAFAGRLRAADNGSLDPHRYIASQADIILNGCAGRPAPSETWA
jgi:TetR/AcrR family transcriptional regulator